jgi:hypothetical protein
MPYCTKTGRWCFRAMFLTRERFIVNRRVRVCSLECAEHWAEAQGEVPVSASCTSEPGRTVHEIRTIPKGQFQRNSETYRPETERPP